MFTKRAQIDHVRILDIELELACNGGSCGRMNIEYRIYFHVKRLLRTSLDFQLVPVQYQEYELGLFSRIDIYDIM